MNIRIRVSARPWRIDSREANFLVALQRALPGTSFVRVARWLSLIAEHAAAWLLLSVLAVFFDADHRLSWMIVGGGVLAAHLSSSALKFLVRRARPTDPRVQQLGSTMSALSFPSSHSANTAAFATGVTLLYPALLIPSIVLVAVMGIARMRLGVHYPSDIAAGILLGVGIALLGHTFVP